jgi:carboxyl-terminal processing protease
MGTSGEAEHGMALRLGDRRTSPRHQAADRARAATPDGHGRARSVRGRLRRAARAVALVPALFLAAPAGVDRPAAAGDYNAYEASRLFAAGYNDIARIYIDEVALPVLALDGLDALATLDRRIAVARGGGEIAVRFHGRTVGSYHVPAPRDIDAWSAVTAGVIDLARRASDRLAERPIAEIYERVFDGMLERLDGYSRYAGADAAQQNRASRDGFGGIGARVHARAGGIAVLSVRDGSPAARAGLAPGDTIVAIDGAATRGLKQREAIDRLRGHVDTTLALSVRRDGGRSVRTLRLRRAHIVPETVATRADGRLAVIEITGFNQETAHAVERAVRKLNARMGARLAGYVLDLRGNPGGLLDQAVDVADLFVRHGRIVSTHGRHPDSHQYFTARPDDIGDDRPVVVLIDGGSASAAEIVAAAIQDNRRGVVVGALSYGKGTVQTVLRLPNRGELTLTWARFHAPSGYALADRGVAPDICTSRHPEPALDQVLARLTAARRADSRAGDPLPEGGERPPDRESVARACPTRPTGSPADLAVARRLLTERALYRSARAAAPAIAQAARP